MFALQELTRLNARKAVLLAESDVNRQELLTHCAKVQPLVSSIEIGISLGQRVKSLYLLAAPLLGIWASRKASSSGAGLWSKLKTGWWLSRVLWRTWRSYNNRLQHE
jgi:hypothetical protein